jgi:hypothetical protein
MNDMMSGGMMWGMGIGGLIVLAIAVPRRRRAGEVRVLPVTS